MSRAAEKRVEKAVAESAARVINAVGDAMVGKKKKTQPQRRKKPAPKEPAPRAVTRKSAAKKRA